MPIKESEVIALLATMPEHSFVRRYVEYASVLTDANMAFHLAGAFAALSTTIPYGERGLSADFGGHIVPNLCMLMYGSSTDSRKTTALKISMRLTKLINKLAVGSEPGSHEGLVESIRDNRRQTIFYPEWGDFLKKTQGNSYLAPLKMAFNNLADGVQLGRALGGLQTKAKTKDPVDNYMVSLLGGVAPVLLERYADYEDWTGGFFGRFLILDAPRERYLLEPGSAPELEIALLNTLKEKLKNQAVGRYCGFDEGARMIWRAFAHDVEWIKDRVSRDVQTSIARSQQITMKMAIQLSWDYGQAGSGHDWQITAAELGPALAIARMHVKSATTIGSTLAVNHDMRDRRLVLGKIDRNMPRTFGEILRGGPMLMRRVKEIVTSLAEEGAIKHTSIGNGDKQVQGWQRVVLLPHEEAEVLSPADLIGTGRLQSHIAEVERKEAEERAKLLAEAGSTTSTNVIRGNFGSGTDPHLAVLPTSAVPKVELATDNDPVQTVMSDERERDTSAGSLPPADPNLETI